MLPEVPPSVSKLLKNVFLGNMFKIAKFLALVLSASLLFSACSGNLRRELVSFDSLWMNRDPSGCDILGYSSCNSRLHGRATWMCCVGLS